MKGVINKGIQDLVEEQLGTEAWEEIKRLAGCDEPFFVIAEDYPDEMTHALIQAAARVAGLDPAAVMVEFGKRWIAHTGPTSYPTFFQVAGSTAREFLYSMDRIHEQVTHSLRGATPPRFTYEERPDGRLRMVLHSQRGLCPIFRGLILGVGAHFGETLEVEETTCSLRGDDRCTMEITFP